MFYITCKNLLTKSSFTFYTPRPKRPDLNSSSQQDYLKRFYSLNLGDHRPPVRSVRSASTMEEKIREMQNFFGLKETGNMDPHTLNVMKEARCGVPDVDNFGFYPNRPKWKNHIITYTWDCIFHVSQISQ